MVKFDSKVDNFAVRVRLEGHAAPEHTADAAACAAHHQRHANAVLRHPIHEGARMGDTLDRVERDVNVPGGRVLELRIALRERHWWDLRLCWRLRLVSAARHGSGGWRDQRRQREEREQQATTYQPPHTSPL